MDDVSKSALRVLAVGELFVEQERLLIGELTRCRHESLPSS